MEGQPSAFSFNASARGAGVRLGSVRGWMMSYWKAFHNHLLETLGSGISPPPGRCCLRHPEAEALGAELGWGCWGWGWGCCSCGCSGGKLGLYFCPGVLWHTRGICGGFWVIFLCGDIVFPFSFFRGNDSLQPDILLVDRHGSDCLFGTRE